MRVLKNDFRMFEPPGKIFSFIPICNKMHTFEKFTDLVVN